MCLSIPAKILKVKGHRADVSVRGIVVEVSIHLLKEARPDDYVLIHAGFAIEKIDQEKAHESLRFLDEIDKLENN
jgi:hydrogenase expression/formation protein HypC